MWYFFDNLNKDERHWPDPEKFIPEVRTFINVGRLSYLFSDSCEMRLRRDTLILIYPSVLVLETVLVNGYVGGFRLDFSHRY